MTKTEAKRHAAKEATSRLQSLLDIGWPCEMVGDSAPPESAADIKRLRDGMARLIADIERTYRL